MMNELDYPAQPRDEDGSLVGGPTKDHAVSSGDEVRDPTAEIQRLREKLLGGRGPGATERERTAFMHNRPTLGALPTMIERELVQVHTDLARRDAAAIEGDLERVRLQLAGGLDQLVAQLSPARLTAIARRHMQTRFEALLGLPPGRPVAESEREPGSSTSSEATAGDAGGRVGPSSTAAPLHPWWWQVATRSAALGAVSTLAVIALIVIFERRRFRSDRRSVGHRQVQRRPAARASAGDRASWR